MRYGFGLLAVLCAGVALAGNVNVSNRVSAYPSAAGCTTSATASETIWLNWDDDVCTTALTTYTPDATLEVSFDSSIAQVSGGNTKVVDTAALQSTSCGLVVDNASNSSYMRLDNFAGSSNDDTYVDGTVGCFVVEWKQTGVTEPVNMELFQVGSVSGQKFTATRLAATDDVRITWTDAGGTSTLTTAGGSCDDFLDGDTAIHVTGICYDTTLGASDYLQLWNDGVKCHELIGAQDRLAWSTGEDIFIGPNGNDTGTVSIDRVGYSKSPTYDWHDVFITQGCQGADGSE